MALDLSALTNPYGQELAGIERNRALATALMQGGQQQPKGEMISGRYVAPSFAQQLNPLLQTGVGLYGQNRADTQQAALVKNSQERQAEILRAYGQAVTPQEKFAIGTSPYAPAALQTATFERLKPQKVGADESIVEYDLGGKGYTPSFTGPSKLPPELQYAVSVGQLPADPKTWNKAQADYAKSLVLEKTNASASKFDFSNLLGKSAIGEVGPMLVASKTAAGSAIQQADAANRILTAVNTDKIFAGAGAEQKLQLAQIGQMLGATGNTADEKIANTRSAIQGLAQLTLQGRQQMKGQGAVTESEGALAQRAVSGDINFTIGEIRQLAEAAKRAGRFQYDQHQSMVGALAKDQPNAVPYYQLEVNPSIFDPYQAKPAKNSQAVNNALSIVRGTTPTGGTK
jgi:hypothetical protein